MKPALGGLFGWLMALVNHRLPLVGNASPARQPDSSDAKTARRDVAGLAHVIERCLRDADLLYAGADDDGIGYLGFSTGPAPVNRRSTVSR